VHEIGQGLLLIVLVDGEIPLAEVVDELRPGVLDGDGDGADRDVDVDVLLFFLLLLGQQGPAVTPARARQKTTRRNLALMKDPGDDPFSPVFSKMTGKVFCEQASDVLELRGQGTLAMLDSYA